MCSMENTSYLSYLIILKNYLLWRYLCMLAAALRPSPIARITVFARNFFVMRPITKVVENNCVGSG